MESHSDAIVIGAGIIGATTALALTQAGFRVTVIDRGGMAHGTTSRGEGNILVSDKSPGPELELALRSRDLWFELDSQVGGGFELEPKGGVVVARSEVGAHALGDLAADQRRNGVDVKGLGAKELHELEPYLDKTIENGAFYPQDAQCQPMLAAAKILKTVQIAGGTLALNAEVKSVNVDSGRIAGVETTRGFHAAPIVVNATGTWANHIAQMAGSSLPIAPRRGFILVTAPAPKLIFHKVYDADYVANVASGSANLQTSAVIEGTQSGTILIGASRERVGFNNQINYEAIKILAAQAISLFPILKNIQLLRIYHGFRPYAPDHLPVIGQDAKVEGLWHNVGHEGAGIGLAPGSAELLTALITETKGFMSADPFSPTRFTGNQGVTT